MGNQCLHFNQQRTIAFHGWHDDRTGNALAAISQEQTTGIRNTEQPLFGHFKQTELISCAETVLDRAQHTQCMVTVTFEGKDGVDDVLEYARTSEATFFGDVTNQHD